MPPRAGTRSQRPPTQTQSRSQRPRQSQANHDDDSEGDDHNMDPGDNEEAGVDEYERKACELVRLAIFSEQRRLPLKRDEISKKVLAGKPRQFAEVMVRAQTILRKTFGMELVELQARLEADDPNQKAKDAMNIKKKATSGTKSYILRSTLPPDLIELATVPDGEILATEMANQAGHDLEDNDSQKFNAGSLISWNSSDELGSVGILYVILALILVSGRVIAETELRKHLKKLRLTPTSLIQFTTQSTHQSLSVDNYLTQLIRQGYLDREQISGKGNGTKKRARGVTSTQARGGEDDTEDWEWRWGPRAMTEVGEVGVAKFIAEFMAQRMPLEAEDAEGAAKKVQIEKRVDALMGGIQKAAGESELVRIKS